MPTSYHHGSLRQALLEEGRRLLAEQGVAAVTMRELARRTGVSYAAPARHFSSREALLAAIADEGFKELAEVLQAAERAGDLPARLSAYAHAHVRFAVTNGALMELMFTRGPGSEQADHPPSPAAVQFFVLGARMLGEQAPHGHLGPLPYLLTAALEGISSLAINGRLPPEQVEEVTDAAVRMMLPAVREQMERTPDHST
ncbi:AcrR family transcriptional regulator [Kineococcus radiotolerans]|uniref:AcrR family transcriptional regulator n=1 Tax=Kineococcus radiotolerans TaxID=131568 RepID=A0A7W4TR01_KINRA|nr:TetR/AcrR family transcriptional regulator [Kineococcus radiotolerans]MBB2903340.1 AcrR family transcriptional regulator [Kineococcus radiotolerans]